jgi:hypothetical protein
VYTARVNENVNRGVQILIAYGDCLIQLRTTFAVQGLFLSGHEIRQPLLLRIKRLCGCNCVNVEDHHHQMKVSQHDPSCA